MTLEHKILLVSDFFPHEAEETIKQSRGLVEGVGWEHLHGPLHITDPAPQAPWSIQGSPQREAGHTRNSPLGSLFSLLPLVINSFPASFVLLCLVPDYLPFLPPYTLIFSPFSLLRSGPRAFKRTRAVRASSPSRGEPGRVLPPDGQPPEPLWRATHAGGRGHCWDSPVRLHRPH